MVRESRKNVGRLENEPSNYEGVAEVRRPGNNSPPLLQKVNDGIPKPDQLFRPRLNIIILNRTMWIHILTACVTLLLLLSVHSFYDYLKNTLTVPKIHDIRTMETNKRKEIDSILEET